MNIKEIKINIPVSHNSMITCNVRIFFYMSLKFLPNIKKTFHEKNNFKIENYIIKSNLLVNFRFLKK